MDEILRQLGGLLLGAIPTIALFLLLYVAYRVLVHGPLERVLSERRDQTEGALERSRADIAAAEAKTAEYEHALREARLSVFKAQEIRRQKALELRSAVVAESRQKAEAQVREAKAALERDMAESKIRLQADSERLASEVIESILRQVGAVSPAGGGQR
ncbi:MAG TPA: ATP synthase F0 subunit B [Terriglobales bacterium]|nr:ATP synthase F0 subunit B [Terriglobales bacterium]